MTTSAPPNPVDYDTALEIASHEAIVRQAYRDSGGVWTWSVGLTGACGHDVERYIGRPQPLGHCLAVYVWALEEYAAEVRAAFDGRTLTREQFAAALSFHWNTGAIGRATWVKKWLAGDVAGARESFMDWRRPPEIVPRREKERDLFFDGKWSNDGTVLEYTRVRANGAPDWGSAIRVDVADALSLALNSGLPEFRHFQTRKSGKPDVLKRDRAAPPADPGPRRHWLARLIAGLWRGARRCT